MAKKPKYTKWGRDWHEERAAQLAQSARRDIGFTRDCSPGAVYALVRAKGDVAQARTHLVSIGAGPESRRTRKLWGIVSKSQRMVDLAGDRVARCMIKKK